jgi:hypothetical protein
MKIFNALAFVCSLAAVGAALAPAARADDFNDRTVVTFSAPVEIPGVHLKGWGVLPAGTYVFKLMDSLSDRKTVITFRERPAGEPEELRAWFYPGRNYGEEFVYPKEKAMEIARSTNTAVIFTPAEIQIEVIEPIQIADAPVIAQLKQAPIQAIQPTGELIELAQVVSPPPPPALVASAATLPGTASNLPLIGLFGLIALGGAFTIGAFAKRV